MGHNTAAAVDWNHYLSHHEKKYFEYVIKTSCTFQIIFFPTSIHSNKFAITIKTYPKLNRHFI